MSTKRFLIDTDAGIDDSVALMLAHSVPGIDIVAVTSIYGTTTLENTTRNVLDVAALIGLTTRVAAGRATPLIAPPREKGTFHGESGRGLAKIPQAAQQAEDAYAWDVMYAEAKKAPGSLTVVTLGPLSNLAVAVLKYPDLPGLLEKIVIMGGSADSGNASAFGEANILHDPHAMEVVLRCGAPIVMAGLNATECTRMTDEEFNRVFSKRTPLSRVLDDMFLTYKRSQNESGETGLVIHDAAAMAVAIWPEIAATKKYHVVCETVRSPMFGRTIVDVRPFAEGEKNVDVVLDIDKAAYLARLAEMLDFYA